MTTTHIEAIPGYVAGTWTIDPSHSEIGFSAQHLMMTQVLGTFTKFEGTIVTGPIVTDSSVTATVDLTSINTGDEIRDDRVRSTDFFDVATATSMTFASTSIVADGDRYLLAGDLTLMGITKPVTFELEIGSFGPDTHGGIRCGFTATTTINRRERGVDFDPPLEPDGTAPSRTDYGMDFNVPLEAATISINPTDYGIDFNVPLETGGVVVGDEITVQLKIEAVLKAEG